MNKKKFKKIHHLLRANQGLKQKLNAKHGLSTRKKIPHTRVVFFCELLKATEVIWHVQLLP